MISPRTFTHSFAGGALLLGLGAWLASTVITDGFFHGFFLGASIALIATSAYVWGAAWRASRSSTDPDQPAHSPGMWLPSRDHDQP